MRSSPCTRVAECTEGTIRRRRDRSSRRASRPAGARPPTRCATGISTRSRSATRSKKILEETRMRIRKLWVAVALATAFPALAQNLTPMGAERAGNAAGTIPAWDGGITKPVAGYQPGQYYPDPFASDRPTLTITGANADQYKAQIPDGAYAMLKKYPDY